MCRTLADAVLAASNAREVEVSNSANFIMMGTRRSITPRARLPAAMLAAAGATWSLEDVACVAGVRAAGRA
jgi:hypothetical protein